MNNLVNVNRELGDVREYGGKILPKIKPYDSILECVGQTPLVKLNKIPKNHGVSCDIYVKCEYMNPGGSIKDRIAVAMVRDAKAVGAIHANTEFVEPTSGNTGIGIVLNAAVLGKKCTVVLAEKNSTEKVDTMSLMGANVLKVKDSITKIAREVKDKNPENVVMLNQYANQVNPRTHYDTTAAEIVAALEKVDMAVMGAGTGGTISGVGLRLKDEYPGCLVVAADPDGSLMINTHGKEHPYLVEGVGGYEPAAQMVLDKSVIDHFEVVTDQESFLMARELARTEGILCGGSAGMAVAAAVKAAKKLNIGVGQSVVVVLPDGIRNYMTKFVSDQWMEAHLFIDPPEHTMRWWKRPITDLVLSHKYPMVDKITTCEQALGMMKNENIAVVIDEKKHFVGAISKDSLRNIITNPLKLPNKTSEEFNFEDPVIKHLAKDTYTLADNGEKGVPTIGLISRMLDITPFVVVVRNVYDVDNDSNHLVPKGVVTGEDILQYVYDQRNI